MIAGGAALCWSGKVLQVGHKMSFTMNTQCEITVWNRTNILMCANNIFSFLSLQFRNASSKESYQSLSISEPQLHLQTDQQIISLNSLCCIFKWLIITGGPYYLMHATLCMKCANPVFHVGKSKNDFKESCWRFKTTKRSFKNKQNKKQTLFVSNLSKST